MKMTRWIQPVLTIAALVGVGTTAYMTQERWLPFLHHEEATTTDVLVEAPTDESVPPSRVVVNEQAQTNLGLVAKSLKPQTYWKTIRVPGMVIDRPGQSDRGVVAPATGVISHVFHFPGDTVQPGDRLFTLMLLSESLHLTQSELFKSTQEIALAESQKARLAAAGSGLPAARIIEVENQITRLQVAVKTYRQELQIRGFEPALIDSIAEGKFVKELTISVPLLLSPDSSKEGTVVSAGVGDMPNSEARFEVEELKVELGQQVQAGQTLCLISNHQRLAIEGRAFRDETPLLERSVTQGWPVEVDFGEETDDWSAPLAEFHIHHLANTIDASTRTFAFRIPLENQSRVIDDNGRTQTLWRFRPGQKLRIQVRVEKFENVYVVPADAVAKEGPEAFVFNQNVNTFERIPVRILLHDRRQVVLANDGTLLPGTYVVQSAAEQLNRMLKSGENSGVPKGYHIHADGSLHKNEDEGK